MCIFIIANLHNIDRVDFIPYDELKYLEQDSDDEDEHLTECKEINDFINNVINSKNQAELNSIMDQMLHKFIDYVKIYRCREEFIR